MARSSKLKSQLQTLIDNTSDALMIGLGKFQQTVLDATGYGRNIYDYDWDVLVVLNSYRADVARTVNEDYEFLSDLEVAYSQGSVSRQWMRNNFTSEY